MAHGLDELPAQSLVRRHLKERTWSIFQTIRKRCLEGPGYFSKPEIETECRSASEPPRQSPGPSQQPSGQAGPSRQCPPSWWLRRARVGLFWTEPPLSGCLFAAGLNRKERCVFHAQRTGPSSPRQDGISGEPQVTTLVLSLQGRKAGHQPRERGRPRGAAWEGCALCLQLARATERGHGEQTGSSLAPHFPPALLPPPPAPPWSRPGSICTAVPR